MSAISETRPAGRAAVSPALPLPLRLAVRELSAGLRGFGIFLACLALGVWAIAGVGSMARSLTEALARDGRVILGGDIAFSLQQREATPLERAFLDAQGRVSSVASLRAMAIAGENGTSLVELKAIDGLYPLVGEMVTDPAQPLATLIARQGDAFGAVVDPAILARLDIKVGDRFTVGDAGFVVAAALTSQPDKVADGVGFAPHLFISQEALRATNLIQPGSLSRWSYRIALPEGRAGDADLARVEAAAKEAHPDAGWNVRTRLKAASNFERNIERFSQFLALVGLTALIVGGVGVANAVRGFVERKRTAIAVMKSVGAPGSRVVMVHLVQVMLVAVMAVVIGLTVGAATPYVVSSLVGDLLPIRLTPTLAPFELGLAAAYGLLCAFAFAIGPLGHAHDVPVAALFRERIEPDRRWPRPRYLVAMALAIGALVLVALFSTTQTRVAAIFLASAAGAFVTLRLVAWGLMALVRRLPRPRRPMVRLALANIHRPSAVTPTLMLSLGLGVTLLVVVALVDANFARQLNRSLPEQAPSFFFLDIPSSRAADFDAFLKAKTQGATIDRVPMMRGRVVSLAGVPAAEIKAAENAAWVLEGDRGITFAATMPEGSRLVEGEWWPADYRGRPLVSFDVELARGLGLKLGDAIVVNVLGRNIEATVANLRQIEWRSLGINFVMVFSPNTFAGAPHTNLATMTLTPAEATPQNEGLLIRDLGRQFPMITAIRVKDALEAVTDVVGKLAIAIRGASGVVLLASLLVLGGALAAGHRARLYDAVILKTLGATRGRLLRAYALEYGLIGLSAALIGLGAGSIAAWYVVAKVMELSFAFDLSAVAAALAAVVVAIVLGLIGAIRVLGQSPARHLRDV